jgi:F0F1-type ATP synthase membrane subunit c/vacuolar-type H+-ATPase subunit K
LEVRVGFFGGARLLMAVEDHGAGTQYVRIRWWPRWLSRGLLAAALFSTLALGAARDAEWFTAGILAAIAGLMMTRGVLESAGAMAMIAGTVREATSRDKTARKEPSFSHVTQA